MPLVTGPHVYPLLLDAKTKVFITFRGSEDGWAADEAEEKGVIKGNS